MKEELKKQIDEWHTSDSHEAIIDSLEKIPTPERDYELISLLARAYNNVDEYTKAIELLESVKTEGEEDAKWNYRIGYALYYMDNNKEALRYFRRANELDPEDEDTLELIRACNVELPFTKRVEDFWSWFLENEPKLSEHSLRKQSANCRKKKSKQSFATPRQTSTVRAMTRGVSS